MLAAQGGGCAVCGDPPGRTALHVDHSHDTGAVRGLLCFRCNSALGNLRDDPAIIASALAYVSRHRRRGAGSVRTRDPAHVLAPR